ncbi:ABC transporter permease [Paenibacillus abyssi]|uniref:Iron(III) ABC transporter permease n=1 Tax=Paenibacillus abyssi TaxID=1340531 RepID=A0A917FTU0_9BACL|nr:iron ABC transporter permease [Paenibacillus abyssi]GGG00777.1 iron(III) ABC transporter permease [Paenibacillus abyssi]
MNNKQSLQKQHTSKVRKPWFRTFFHYCSVKWNKLWNGHPPDYVLLTIASITALVMSVPIIYVIWRSLFAGSERWLKLLDTRIPGLLWNTLSLTFVVTALAVTMGVALAWFVNRCDLPGGKTWQWLLALPLVIPPYVGAMTYIIILGPRGWLWDVWGSQPWLQSIFENYPINIYSFWGLVFVLTMFTYPYVFLIASASLRKMNRNFEDAARSQGYSMQSIFWKISLPFLRPAIGAGAILIALYVLSDFGAISMLRYMTFTSAIYYQMGSFDSVAATVLSMVLILITIVVLWIEASTRKRTVHQTSNSYKPPELIKLGRWKTLVMGIVLAVFVLSVVLPVIVLVYWSSIGISMGAINSKFWQYTWNSILVCGLASLFSMLLALPLIYLKSRYRSVFTRMIDRLAYSGYALPGIIVALGIIFIFNNYIQLLYGSFILIAIAYIVRFLPQAMQSGEASLNLISPRIDEAARSLGHSSLKILFKITLPLIMPGVLAGGALVFVSSMKELPATLLLRPPGFDTLSVRIWVEAGEAVYHLAAPAALLVILVATLPLRWMLNK